MSACECTHTFANTHLWEGVAAPDASSSSLFFSSSMVISSAAVCSRLVLAVHGGGGDPWPACVLRGDLSAVILKCQTHHTHGGFVLLCVHVDSFASG